MRGHRHHTWYMRDICMGYVCAWDTLDGVGVGVGDGDGAVGGMGWVGVG